MQLVTVNNGLPVTTTWAIADGLEVEHKAIIQLVRKHQADLEEFGRVTFEMLPFETAGCAHPVAYQDKLQQMLLEHKTTIVNRTDGTEKITEQVRITAKGLAKLALVFAEATP